MKTPQTADAPSSFRTVLLLTGPLPRAVASLDRPDRSFVRDSAPCRTSTVGLARDEFPLPDLAPALSFVPVPAPVPEIELARLTAARGPLRRTLARLAGRLVETRAIERFGFARLGDYARERVGLSARKVQELARIDRLLAGLPSLEASLRRNVLPWCKVRLIARIAKLETVDGWIERARTRPARRLEGAGDVCPERVWDLVPSAERQLCAPGVRAEATRLCAFHHLRGVHAGRARVRGRAPSWLVFELGLRDGGRGVGGVGGVGRAGAEEPPLVGYRSGDVLMAN